MYNSKCLLNHRARRVKCGEEKPYCQRCIKANRHCAGYSPLTTLDNQPKPFNITYYVSDVISANSALVEVLGDTQEQYALEYFYQWTARSFPSKLIIPFRQPNIIHEPVIRHAMIAIGILQDLDQYNITSQARTKRRVVAMQHYGEALHILLLRKPDAIQSTVSISLLACILFVCLETLHGRHRSALSHLQSGYRLFQEAKENETLDNSSYASEPIFRSLFVRLTCQITTFDSANCARFLGLANIASEDPIQFASLDEARISFGNIVERAIQSEHLRIVPGRNPDFTNLPSAESFDRSLVQELLELDRWILAFNLYLSHGVSASHTCDSYVLLVCSFFLKFRITMVCRGFAEVSENTKIDFAPIASLGEVLSAEYDTSIRSQTKSSRAGWTDPQLNCPLHRLFIRKQVSTSQPSGLAVFFFLGVFCSLYVASMHSQDPAIRRKAHDAILKTCRCEKGWDPSLTLHIASLLSPRRGATEWHGNGLHKANLDPDYSNLGIITSPGTDALLAVLHSFNKF